MAKPQPHDETPPVIWWLKQDLRLADNPALTAAFKTSAPLIALYVLDDETPGAWRIGGASRWWLHYSLRALARDLEARGATLTLRRGRAADILPEVLRETGARAVFWNRQYEPFAIARDEALKVALEQQGVVVTTSNSALLVEPWTVKTGSDGPFRVFTPFWKAASSRVAVDAPLPPPKRIAAPARPPRSDALDAWALTPTAPNWAKGFAPLWQPGEAGAKQRLAAFIDEALPAYATDRDKPDRSGTSRLSPHLHWGEISPRAVWRAIATRAEAGGGTLAAPADKFFSELGWREFAHHLLFHFPHIPDGNFRAAFDAFPWRRDDKALRAWSQGRTGYPIVDAGMRELWTTGWMHNRVRMIVASFLIKDLLLDWREGERWFWDTLLDADLANNAASWQWVAGSGADAAPYFRIFNPVTQGEKFDPDGAYVRRWLPELATLDTRLVHRPWESGAPPKDYPARIVDHAAARDRALAAFAKIKA